MTDDEDGGRSGGACGGGQQAADPESSRPRRRGLPRKVSTAPCRRMASLPAPADARHPGLAAPADAPGGRPLAGRSCASMAGWCGRCRLGLLGETLDDLLVWEPKTAADFAEAPGRPYRPRWEGLPSLFRYEARTEGAGSIGLRLWPGSGYPLLVCVVSVLASPGTGDTGMPIQRPVRRRNRILAGAGKRPRRVRSQRRCCASRPRGRRGCLAALWDDRAVAAGSRGTGCRVNRAVRCPSRR